ncbi:hypothetical protein L6164_001111 [Bauhinia variegata]|uniref:Uncharacterized protein n=1 Tax=Bauhinia variegata TaxID=167791 RepID=A0ACB9Q9X7_BAUVA|nr:hypothetical protein L6164_001111 [Bauhinia variegata]
MDTMLCIKESGSPDLKAFGEGKQIANKGPSHITRGQLVFLFPSLISIPPVHFFKRGRKTEKHGYCVVHKEVWVSRSEGFW